LLLVIRHHLFDIRQSSAVSVTKSSDIEGFRCQVSGVSAAANKENVWPNRQKFLSVENRLSNKGILSI
jgi:hypothetical protein